MSAAWPSAGSASGRITPVSLFARADLLDHARRPRNRGALERATLVQEETNPLCGDSVRVYARLGTREGRSDSLLLTELSFLGSGCIISQAAASLLTTSLVGKKTADVLQMGRSEIEELLGGPLTPARVPCGMLALVALQRGLQPHASGT